MPIVKFNSVDEFCEELKKDAKLIDRGIVRVTQLYKSSRVSPNIQMLSVLATYSVNGQLVRLECPCGDLWNIQGEDSKRYAVAGEHIKQITDLVGTLEGLQVRNGTLDEIA